MAVLPEETTRSVGFVLDGRLRPIGTFFVVSTEYGPLMVTARHVAEVAQGGRVRIRESNRGVVDWEGVRWVYSATRSRLDVAVASFTPPVIGQYHGVSLDDAADRIDVAPKLGGDAVYIGLLTGIDVMGLEARAVVRRGSVAAVEVRGVEWQNGEWTADRVHLIDISSHPGLSGSPCFFVATYPGPRKKPLPPAFAAMVSRSGADPNELGDPHYFGTLWGMHVAAATGTGIGVVVPVDLLRSVIAEAGAGGLLSQSAPWRLSRHPGG